MCEDCHRVEAKDYWRSCVQVRQKATHKKTLFYLEQLVLKHKAHVNATGIKQVHEGLDFYYQQQSDAKKLVEFLQSVVPCRTSSAKELVSHDPRSNVYNYKHVFSVEIVPVCKDNIVCLPAPLAHQLGNMAQICVVLRVTQVIHLIDVNTCHTADLRGDVFWRTPFVPLCDVRQLTRFVVMDSEVIADSDRRHIPGQGPESLKHVLADVWVVKESELGNTEQQIHCRTHLGHLLSPGDIVLGFDLKNANVNDFNFDQMKADKLPDVVLVKKVFGDSGRRARKRQWKLRHLEELHENDGDSVQRDYNDFLEDLEEDVAYRQNVNIFKAGNVAVEPSETDDEDIPRVTLAEMLEDLHIADDATGGEGASMMD
jgi:nonsense-mediated mRNA decay protein 3